MADITNDETIEESTANPGADVEMTEGGGNEDEGVAERSELPFAGEDTVVEPEPEPVRVPFADYLSSPIVTLIVGSGEKETILTAHQALLTRSPYFQTVCDGFTDDGSVSSYPARFPNIIAVILPLVWRAVKQWKLILSSSC